MSELDYYTLISSVPIAAAMLIVAALIAWRFPSMIDSATRFVERINDGKKQDAIAQAKVIEAGTDAVRISVAALKDAVATQVDAFTSQVAALRIEYKAEIEALKENFAMENTKKDDEIRKLKEEVARLKAENAALKSENTQTKEKVSELEDKLRAKANKRKLMQGDGDGNRAGIGEPGK